MLVAEAKHKQVFYHCPFCGREKGGFKTLRRARRALEIHKGHMHPRSDRYSWHRAGTMRYEGFDGDSFIGEIYRDSDGWNAIPNVELSSEEISRVFATKNAAQRYVESVYENTALVLLTN